jgi:membrane protease YdiL (CAAX protease family)
MLLALILTWLYERTGSLWAPIVTHSAFNAANFVWLTLSPSLGWIQRP